MIEQERPVEPILVRMMTDIGITISEVLAKTTARTGKQYGFALLMFSLGDGDDSRMNYMSNCSREDMLVALKEFIARNEGTYQADSNKGRRH